MTYTASEMREMAAINDDKASQCRAQSRPGAAEEYETTAQMLRQAADAMEAIRDHVDAADACVSGDDDVAAMLKFAETDQRIRKLAAMQDKGEG